MTKCKRCGRELKNPESIKRGYGKTCYRITQFQKPEEQREEGVNINEIKTFITTEINRVLKEFNFNRSVVQSNISGIEPIKISKMPKFDINEVNKRLVVKELKEQLSKGIGAVLHEIGSFDNQINFLEAPIEMFA